MRAADFMRGVRDSGGTILGAGFVLIFTVPMVRVMINSGVNANDLASMPISMARGVADLMGHVYPLLAPSVGALGAFLAGSNTVSNLMLAQFQFEPRPADPVGRADGGAPERGRCCRQHDRHSQRGGGVRDRGTAGP